MAFGRPYWMTAIALLTGLLVGRYLVPAQAAFPATLEDKYELATRIFVSCDGLEREAMLLELQRTHAIWIERAKKLRSNLDGTKNTSPPPIAKEVLSASPTDVAAQPTKGVVVAEPLPPVPVYANPITAPLTPQPVNEPLDITKLRQETPAQRDKRLDQESEARKSEQRLAAIASSQFRQWGILGGREASEAKIVYYRDGLLSLEKRDGKVRDVRINRLNKVDREYADQWVKANGFDDP